MDRRKFLLEVAGAGLAITGTGASCRGEKPVIFENENQTDDTAEPNLPYIYEDPNLSTDVIRQIQTVCTKHGRLDWGETWVFGDSPKRYCGRCVNEVITMYLDRHIGNEPNVTPLF